MRTSFAAGEINCQGFLEGWEDAYHTSASGRKHLVGSGCLSPLQAHGWPAFVGSLGLDLLGSTFVGMGMSLPALVLFFLTWMQNSERRRWIISGPYPLDRLGSGPLQVWIGILGVVVGCILLSLGLIIRTYAFSSDSRSNHTHS